MKQKNRVTEKWYFIKPCLFITEINDEHRRNNKDEHGRRRYYRYDQPHYTRAQPVQELEILPVNFPGEGGGGGGGGKRIRSSVGMLAAPFRPLYTKESVFCLFSFSWETPILDQAA